MHYRAIPWILWSMRVSGWLYYMDNIVWDASKMNYAGKRRSNEIIFYNKMQHDNVLQLLGGWQPPRPRVSASLIREGMEDYEYLYQANCRRRPEVDQRTSIDQTAMSIGFNIGYILFFDIFLLVVISIPYFCLEYSFSRVWTDDESSVHALRHELGLYLEGTRAQMPYLTTPFMRPFGDYNIDFTRY